ncbi:MAG: leucine-rich repeat domain-containing protein [Muribaculaceae bacterium]|nr:leucine-rich repeat domain-containing protein [Muribaculaceae bacterium]MCM1440479.1 leucine-rich repeat domain-containing protein [Roseburia sp.]
MKKKIILSLLAFVCAITCAFGLVACGGEHTHDYGSWKTDEDFHWHECKNSGCDEKIKDRNGHSDFDSDGRCDVCQYQMTVEHIHVWTWKSSQDVHWQICSCGEGTEEEKHEFVNGVCVCGQKEVAGLTHSWQTTWETTASYHWHNCDDCSEIDSYGPHEFVNGVCVCGYNPSELLTFELNEDEESYTVTGVSDKNIKEIIIPAKYNDKDVTAIGYQAFDSCYYLTSVTIPDTVTDIGTNAFAYCNQLTSVKIPESVTSIGYFAFGNCTSLSSVEISDSVTYVPGDAFNFTPWLESQPDGLLYLGKVAYKYIGTMPENTAITIKDGTKSIATYAFDECAGLTNIVIPSGVTSIGAYAFRNCTELKSITIPDSVTAATYAFSYTSIETLTIPASLAQYWGAMSGLSTTLKSVTVTSGGNAILDQAFQGCSVLESVTILYGVESIGESAFYGCEALTDITIPDSVTSIGRSAFERCTSLENITIPSSVESIDYRAFYNCTSLDNLVIPRGIKSIANSAFENCTSLTNVTIGDSLTSIGQAGSSLDVFFRCPIETAKIPAIAARYLPMETLKTVTVTGGDGGNELPDYAFGSSGISENTALISVTIQYGVTGIGKQAFQQCVALESVTMPDSIKSIGEEAFNGCNSLKSLYIPEGVTTIGHRAFAYSGLTSIIIPDSVTEVGSYLFENCTSIESATFPMSAAAEIASDLKKTVKEIEITSGTVNDSIMYYQNIFRNSLLLTSVRIGERVTRIPEGLFESCTLLDTVTFSNNSHLTSIGDDAFAGCSALTAINIPYGVESIEASAFYHCASLKTVAIPSSVTSIGERAFEGCPVENASIPSSARRFIPLTGLKKLEIISGSLVESAFDGCANLTDVTISSSVTSVAENAFNGCPIETASLPQKFLKCIPASALKTVSVSGGTAILDTTFASYTALESITLSSSITSIDESAFDNCAALTDITFSGTTEQWNTIISGWSKTLNCTIHCKDGVIDSNVSL